jgi:hypothetical protein
MIGPILLEFCESEHYFVDLLIRSEMLKAAQRRLPVPTEYFYQAMPICEDFKGICLSTGQGVSIPEWHVRCLCCTEGNRRRP